ncbi:MAG: hypothetical protein IJT66_06470 [Clostridia bacterium]|nr:hypothetical protein [Clostridia bacterium]
MDEETLRQEDTVAHMREINARTSPMLPIPPFVRLPRQPSSRPSDVPLSPPSPSAQSATSPRPAFASQEIPPRHPHEPEPPHKPQPHREPEKHHRPPPTAPGFPPPPYPPKSGGGLLSFLQGFDLPFLNDLTADSDLPLLLSLLLLLWGEKADKKLLFALIFILM